MSEAVREDSLAEREQPTVTRTVTRTVTDGLRAAPALRRGLALTVVFALLGAGGRIVVPILIQQAIDSGTTRISTATLTLNTGRVLLLSCIGAVCLIIASVSQRSAVSRLGRRSEEALLDLRVRLFEHIHRIGVEDHNDEKRGALVARVTSDVETLSQFFSWGALAFLLNGALMLIVGVVMLAYEWRLALIVFVVATPLVLVLRRVQVRLVAAYERTRAANAELLGTSAELVTGADTIRAYGAGPVFARRAKSAAARRARDQIRATFIGALLFPSGEVFGVLAISAIVLVGWDLGPTSGLTAGALVGFIFLTYRFLEPVAELSEVIDQTQTAVAGLRRVLGVLDIAETPPPPRSPVPFPSGDLDIGIHDVSFRYRPRSGEETAPEPAVSGVDVTIPFGTSVAIVGSTGSGKTTLGRLLVRFLDPTSGSITIGGVAIDRIANEDFRRHVLVVPQEPFLFDGTIGDNARFARPDCSDDELMALVDVMGLRSWLDTVEGGLGARVGPRGSRLSAGERQLVALIRAAVTNPAVLVLDEATSSVDALTEMRLQQALETLARGRTTIAIAHRLSTALRADRILVMVAGRVVEDGSHDHLMASAGTYATLYAAWERSTESTHGISP